MRNATKKQKKKKAFVTERYLNMLDYNIDDNDQRKITASFV
jgi:hypothetical protein